MRSTTPSGAWARRVVVLVTIATVALGLGAGAAFARVKSRTASATATDACQALINGAYAPDSREEANASRTCAAACGVLVDETRVKREDQATIDNALVTCADACAFILEESQNTRRSGGPIVLAAEACWVALETGAEALPTTDTGGRSWR